MRLAYFSPLNPAPSGISDYSEELLPALGAHADITLVVDGYTPTNRALTARFPVMDDRTYDPNAFDLALYHLGNSPAHAYIYRRALREPGVIVLHDVVLHHLVAWLTLEHDDAAGYIAAMREAYGEQGAAVAAREAQGREGLDRFAYPLSEKVLESARGVIVHSVYAADFVRRAAPQVPVAQIPHEMPPMTVRAQADARRALGLPPDAFLVGSFGHLGPTKRAPVLLDAFRSLVQHAPNARLLLVGGVSPNFDARGLIQLFGLENAAQVVGHVPFDQFHEYMAAVDVCVNLRYPTAGETSGAALRMMAQQKPVVVSRTGWFGELPANAVAKIDVDDYEVALLSATLERLYRDARLRAVMGENARRYILETCDVDAAAGAYAEFLRAVVEGKSTVDSGQSTVKDERSFASPPLRGQARDKLPTNDKLLAANDQRPAMNDYIALAYTGLGLRADDALLRELARAAVELGLNE